MNKKITNQNLHVMKENAEQAEKLLKMLANSKRLLILCNLLKEEKTVSELQELVGLSQSALSQHLAKMRQEDLLTTNKVGTRIYYRVENPEVETIISALYSMYCNI